MMKKKSQNNKPVNSVLLDQARLEIDRERLKIEEERTQLERRLFYKHFGAILAAVISFVALLVSVGQIYINKHLGDQQAQILRDQQQRQAQSQQDQITLTRSLKDIEHETRATDNSLKLAQFLVDNQAELLSADESKRKRMETILFATFDPRVIVPVLERLKGVQFTPHSQEKLESLLNKARELETTSTELQAQNESRQRVNIRSSAPTTSSEETSQRVTLVDETSQRVALVIGNGAYERASLKNSVNDAHDTAQALRELGFEVIYNENINQRDMKRSIRIFGEKLRSSKGVGLFYYAGHGIQVKGINYLIPTDAKFTNEVDVEYEGVDVSYVIAQMQSANNPMNIVILDSCRNDPFGGANARSISIRSQGLAQMDAPAGTIIAYATSPGSIAIDGIGRNGLYTQELLKNIRVPGLSIEEVFKRVRISVRKLTQGNQIPWEASSLEGDFYFVNKKDPSASKEPTTETSANLKR